MTSDNEIFKANCNSLAALQLDLSATLAPSALCSCYTPLSPTRQQQRHAAMLSSVAMTQLLLRHHRYPRDRRRLLDSNRVAFSMFYI